MFRVIFCYSDTDCDVVLTFLFKKLPFYVNKKKQEEAAALEEGELA